MTEFNEKLYYIETGLIEIGESYDSAECPARDSRTISYDRNKCSIGKEQRKAIADAIHKFFEAKYGIDPDHLGIHFSNDLDEHKVGKGSICPKGIDLNTPPHVKISSDEGKRAFETVSSFNNEHRLDHFRTVKSSNSFFSAQTWEDVAKGLNEQFKRLGQPDIQIDTDLFIRK